MASGGERQREPVLIVDADIHVNDTPDALAPYCAMPWRKSLEALPAGHGDYLSVPGFSPNLQARSADSGQHRQPLGHYRGGDARRAERAGDRHRHPLPRQHAPLRPHAEHRIRHRALPRLQSLAARRVAAAQEPGLYGVLLACPQNPEATRPGDRALREEERIVGVYLPTAGVNPLWGDRKYDPILAAAQEADLPVCLHSVTVVTPAFPCQLDQFENHFARQVLSHSFAMMANLTSIMHTGVPARYPEAAGRLHRGRHRLGAVHDVAHGQVLQRISPAGPLPGAAPERLHAGADVVRHPADRGAGRPARSGRHHRPDRRPERILFASDWPHHDFDHPRAIMKLPMPPEAKRQIMGENALSSSAFRNPRPASYRSAG